MNHDDLRLAAEVGAELAAENDDFPARGDNFETLGLMLDLGRDLTQACLLLKDLCFTYHGPETAAAAAWLESHREYWWDAERYTPADDRDARPDDDLGAAAGDERS